MRLACLLLATAILVGCGGDSGTIPVDAGPLDTCAVGAWRGVPSARCACAEIGRPDLTPECSAPDCMVSPILVLRADGTAVSFEIHWSDARATFSVVNGCTRIVDRTWRAASEHEIVLISSLGSEFTYEATCDAGRLTRDGAIFERLSGPIVPALESLPTADDCQAVSFGA